MAPVGGNSRLDVDDDDDSSLLHLFDDYEDYEREMMKYEAYHDAMKLVEESYAVGFLTEPIFPTEIPSGVKNVVHSTGVKNGELEGMHGTSSMAMGNTSDGVNSRLDDNDDDSSLLHLSDDYEDYERDKNGELEGMHGTSSMAWGSTSDGGSVAAGIGLVGIWHLAEDFEHALVLSSSEENEDVSPFLVGIGHRPRPSTLFSEQKAKKRHAEEMTPDTGLGLF